MRFQMSNFWFCLGFNFKNLFSIQSGQNGVLIGDYIIKVVMCITVKMGQSIPIQLKLHEPRNLEGWDGLILHLEGS